MKKKLTLSLILYISIYLLTAETVVLQDFEAENLNEIYGQYGKSYLQLEDGEFSADPYTDLLLHFNDNMFTDRSGNYTISEHYNNITETHKKYGDSSLFLVKNRGISYKSDLETLFSPGRVVDDFTIEFWIKPTIISEDSTLFSWKGVNKVESEFIPQKIKCFIEERYIIWEFDNFFIPSDNSKFNIKLKSLNRIIPNRWTHIAIRYNSETGMLESLVDEQSNAITYSTDTGLESNNIYQPIIGNFSKNIIYIGENFQGFIDEFRITELFINNINKNSFHRTGSFITPVVKFNNCLITSIESHDIVPNETLIDYYIRYSQEPFLSDDTTIPWIPMADLKENSNHRYIQLKGILYSDGNSSKTPMFEKFVIQTEQVLPPPTPQYITSTADKNSITVEWLASKYYPVDGYYLYIGDKKNNYYEMIDTGKKTTYTINNLQSKKIYYFAVRAYKNSLKSEYSTEIYNRPD